MLDAIRLFVRNGNRRPIVAPTAAQDRTISTAPYVETGKRPRAAKECLCGCKFIAAVPPERSEGMIELAEGCPQACSQPHSWEMLHGLIRHLHLRVAFLVDQTVASWLQCRCDGLCHSCHSA